MCLTCATSNIESMIDELIEYMAVYTLEEIKEELEIIKKAVINLAN